MEQREAESAPPAQPSAGPTDEVPSLFPATEARGFLDRWGEVQSRFVDDPKRAVQDGDALVAEVMHTLAASFARQRPTSRVSGTPGTRRLMTCATHSSATAPSFSGCSPRDRQSAPRSPSPANQPTLVTGEVGLSHKRRLGDDSHSTL